MEKSAVNALKGAITIAKKRRSWTPQACLLRRSSLPSSAALGGLKVSDIINMQYYGGPSNYGVYCSAQELSGVLATIAPGTLFSLEASDGSKGPQIHDFTMGISGEAVEIAADTGTKNGKKSRRK